MTVLSRLAAWWRGELDAPLPDWTITPGPIAGHRWACTHYAATGGHSTDTSAEQAARSHFLAAHSGTHKRTTP